MGPWAGAFGNERCVSCVIHRVVRESCSILELVLVEKVRLQPQRKERRDERAERNREATHKPKGKQHGKIGAHAMGGDHLGCSTVGLQKIARLPERIDERCEEALGAHIVVVVERPMHAGKSQIRPWDLVPGEERHL